MDDEKKPKKGRGGEGEYKNELPVTCNVGKSKAMKKIQLSILFF